MSSNSDSNAVTINAVFLKALVQYQLQPLLDQVDTLLKNGQEQHIHGGSGNTEIPMIDSTLKVPAGGVAQQNGNSFPPAGELINALGTVGGSVNTNLTWFQQALTDTIDEIGTVVTSMKDTDSLNAQSAQQLQQSFGGAINDLGTAPGSGAGGGGGSGGSSSGSGSGGSGSSHG